MDTRPYVYCSVRDVPPLHEIAQLMMKIGLQFPDELLPSSVPVFRAIQTGIAHTGAQAYVLGDSTYGR